MREAAIVATARTGIGKAHRGAFNDTEAPVLSSHVVDDVKSVTTRVAVKVIAGGAGVAHFVIASATDENIVAFSTLQLIPSCSTDQRVISITARHAEPGTEHQLPIRGCHKSCLQPDRLHAC